MKIETTHYFKGRDGHQAESHSVTDANGNIWQISTHKTRKGVQCTATQGQDNGNGSISFNLSNQMGGYNDKYLNLAEEAGQCNEAKVKRVHEAGLIAFLKHFEGQPESEKYILGAGQIIYQETNWSRPSKQGQVIYEVTSPGHFKTVTLDGKRLFTADVLTIGPEYVEGNLMPLDEVQELVKAATAEQERQRINRERNEQEAREERARKIEAGKKIIAAIPAGVKAVIVANLRKDESDHMTDYFHSTTIKTVYLAWSEHTKDVFSELRKAAAKFEETQEYSVTPTMPEGENPEYWKPEDEHREKYTGGHGYYLGKTKYSGWIVEKENFGQYGPTLERIQIAAAEGLFLCNEAPAKGERTAPQYEPQKVPAGTVQIIEYSAKAIAVIGETKPIKDILGRDGLGGIFNARLSCGPGWIFPKSKLEEVQKRLSEIKGKPAPAQAEDFNEKFSRMDEPAEPMRLIAAPEPEEVEEQPLTTAEVQRFNEMADHSEEPKEFIDLFCRSFNTNEPRANLFLHAIKDSKFETIRKENGQAMFE